MNIPSKPSVATVFRWPMADSVQNYLKIANLRYGQHGEGEGNSKTVMKCIKKKMIIMRSNQI